MGISEFKYLAKNIINFFNENEISLYEGVPNTLEDFLAFLINSDNDTDIETHIENYMDKNPNITYPKCIFDGTENFHTFFPNDIHEKILNFNKWDFSDLYIKKIDYDLDKLRSKRQRISSLNNSISQEEINSKIYTLINNFGAKFQKELKTMLSVYDCACFDSTDFIFLLRKLFSTCLALLDDIPFSDSCRKIRSNTTVHIDYTQSDFSSLKTAMEKNFRIIISGTRGSGKTTFIKDYLSKTKFTDICYLNYTDSIDNTLSKICFFDATTPTLPYKEICSLLKKKIGSSILIIDDMNLSSNQLSKELKKIDSLKLRIFIITCNTLYENSEYTFVPVPTFSEDKLIDYYQKISKISNLTQDFKTHILKWTSKKPLLVSLLAYASKKNPDAVKQLLFKDEFVYNLSNLSFKYPYDNQTKSLIGHIKKLYDIALFKHEDIILQQYLKELSCFFNYTIPIAFLEKIIPEFDIVNIEKLSDLGFLAYSKEANTVQLSAPIADMIYTVEKPSITNLTELLENITKYIENYDIMLNEFPLSDLLYPLIKRLQGTVIVKNNNHQKEVAEVQNNWWRFVYQCIEYYQSIGNYDAAKQLIQLLKYPDKKTIRYSQSPLDKELFSLVNIWNKNDPIFYQTIDRLINHIQKQKLSLNKFEKHYEIYMPNLVLCNYLASIALDRIILRIVSLQHLFYPINVNYESLYVNLLNLIATSDAPYPEVKAIYYRAAYIILSHDIETMSYRFIRKFFDKILLCKNKALQIQMLTIIACQCFNIIQYSSGTTKHIEITKFTRDTLFVQLYSILNCCVFLPKYVFKLCYFSFLRYKELCPFKKENILNLATVFDNLIKKCPVLSSEEKNFYLSLKP